MKDLTTRLSAPALPAAITAGGPRARRRFVEFFVAELENPHTRRAYARTAVHFFNWCERRGVRSIDSVTPIVVAAYIKFLRESKSERTRVDRSKPTVKQALSALRRLFDYLVVDHVMEVNPALSVRGPKHVVTTGKTSHLEPEQMRQLFASIDSSTLIGLRDRALIAIMAYGFARVGAVVAMRVEDYFQMGKRWHFRLHEKNSKVLAMPAHHTAEEFVDAYLNAVGIGWEKKSPLFRSMTRWGRVNRTAMTENDAYRMVKKRAKAAGLPYTTKNHTFRTTSCTTYLANGGKLEKAQQMMGHSDPRTTKLYDHTDDKLTLDEVEKIAY